MKNIKFLILTVIFSIICVGCGAPDPLALKDTSFTVGLGEEIDTDPSIYLQTTDEQVLQETKFNFKNVDTSKAGVYRATASYNNKRVEFRMEVMDQMPPSAEVRSAVSGEANKQILATDILSSITENSNQVTVSFKDHGCEASVGSVLFGDVVVDGEALMYEEDGEYENVLTLTDSSGNSAEFPFHILISKNPVISGTKDISVETGETINYQKGVTAEDCDGNDVTKYIQVDHSAVDVNTPGTYEVTYSVTDAKGRTGKTTIQVTVTEKTSVPEQTKTDDTKTDDSNNSSGTSQKADRGSSSKKSDSSASSGNGSTKKDTTTKKPSAKPAEKDTQSSSSKPASKPSESNTSKPADKPSDTNSNSQKPAEEEPEPEEDDGADDEREPVHDDPGLY